MERILRVVAAMYREHGYDQCSMADMAKRVGFSAPAFYHYFRSKEEILAAFLEYTIADLLATVSARITGDTWSEKLASFMRAYVLWHLQQTPFPEAYERIFALGHLRNSLPPLLRKKILASERKFYELCRELVAGGIAAKEFRKTPVAPATFAILGISDYILGWYRSKGPLAPARLADEYAELVVRMLQADKKPTK